MPLKERRMQVLNHLLALRWPPRGAASPARPEGARFDVRLLAMLGVLAVIWIAFDLLTGGLFLSSRNLFNLSLQVSVVGIMAAGMILVIVARHIDLSVGSQVGFLGVLGALVQTAWLAPGNPHAWWLSSAVMLAAGVGIGALQGALVAYAGIPSFVVTLGGLLFLRNAAYQLNSGATIAPLDGTFQMLGGGPNGAIGGAASWALAGATLIVLVSTALRSRRRKQRYGVAQAHPAIEASILACWAAAIVLFVIAMNGYARPSTNEAMGIPVPVLVLIAVTLAISAVAQRHRFGRHVFAVGGDPQSAQLAGIDTRWVVMRVFMLMGLLCGLASIVLTARLNAAASGSGTMMELYVIAAAVIGGTSLAGGAGTILGGTVGALVMQSLQGGMVLLGVPSPIQSMVLAGVLVVAVWLDTLWRGRAK